MVGERSPGSERGAQDPHARVALAAFRLWMRYFRFETEDLSVLKTTEPSLIVAYHGGPWAFDLLMLGARMHDELGYFPHAIWHRLWWKFPVLRPAVTALGGLSRAPTAAEVEAIKARGEHLAVAPAGDTEGMRPFWKNYQVDFGRRRGYLRLAHTHELPIIPVVAAGVDETFVGLSGELRLPGVLSGGEPFPAWLGVGVGGIWPLALPFPAKIRQRIGAPIRPDSLKIGTGGELRFERAHEHVTAVLQEMLDELLVQHPPCSGKAARWLRR